MCKVPFKRNVLSPHSQHQWGQGLPHRHPNRASKQPCVAVMKGFWIKGEQHDLSHPSPCIWMSNSQNLSIQKTLMGPWVISLSLNSLWGTKRNLGILPWATIFWVVFFFYTWFKTAPILCITGISNHSSKMKIKHKMKNWFRSKAGHTQVK